jgi:hypothetical protein
LRDRIRSGIIAPGVRRVSTVSVLREGEHTRRPYHRLYRAKPGRGVRNQVEQHTLFRARWAFENDIIDAFPFLLYSKDREEWIHYFGKPYMTIQNIICSRKDISASAGKSDSLSELMAGSTLVFPRSTGYKYPFLSDSRIEQINIPFSEYIAAH